MDNDDKESKTEDASQKKIDKAIDSGDTAHSKELQYISFLIILYIIIIQIGSNSAFIIEQKLSLLFESLKYFHFDNYYDRQLLYNEVRTHIFIPLCITLILFFFIHIVVQCAQGIPQFNPERLKLNFDAINIKKNLSFLFSISNIFEFLKSLTKLCAAIFITIYCLYKSRQKIYIMFSAEYYYSLVLLIEILKETIAYFLFYLIALAGIDYIYNKYNWLMKLKMTRQEAKDEYKENEGDPFVKSKMKNMRLKKARNRMMADVPSSTVIITNPTHFAIALRYRQGVDRAPVVVAKGVDAVAEKIKEIAREHNVQLIENKLLARSLYHTVEIGDFIPEEFYKAMAEIISYIRRLNMSNTYA